MVDMRRTVAVSPGRLRPGAYDRDRGAIDRVGHARGLGGGHFEHREALEHPHVAHRFAVEPRL
jgi:hypothetical protein